jgi:cyanate lyase
MSIATEQDYTQAVAAEVRAMIARKALRHKEIAAALGKSEMWMSRRVSGQNAWSAADLYGLARVLGCDVHDLLPVGSVVTGGFWSPVTGAVSDFTPLAA